MAEVIVALDLKSRAEAEAAVEQLPGFHQGDIAAFAKEC